jgi:general secretion pathway protein K
VKNSRGFALLAALWLLVAFSVASLALSAGARRWRLAAANRVEWLRAQAAANAGIEQLRQRLAARLEPTVPAPIDPWHGADSLLRDTLDFGDVRSLIRAQDVGAALNLNRASEDELRRLFVALRVDAGAADRLAQAIADWRDPDDLHRMRGAERDAYVAAGASVLPRNGPFQSIAELLDVRGMTSTLYAQVRPYLTLFGSGQININVADRPVLLTLPGFGEEAVAVVFRYRRSRRTIGILQDLERELPPPARRELAAALPQLLGRTITETKEIEVASEAWLPGSPVRARVTGLLVRSRESMFYVWSRAE